MWIEWRDMLLKQIKNPPFIPTHSSTNWGEEWVGGVGWGGGDTDHNGI